MQPRRRYLSYAEKPPEARFCETVHERGGAMAMHRHMGSYASFVLSGGYIEYGVDGRIEVAAGDLLIHPPLNAHGDLFHRSDARVFSVDLPDDGAPGGTRAIRIRARRKFQAELRRRPEQAAEMIFDEASRRDQHLSPLAPPRFTRTAAEAWQAGAPLSVQDAASEAGVSAEHFSRRFKAHFGVAPAAYRSEWRFRRAANAIAKGGRLADAASDCGYADQSHMTRDFTLRAQRAPRSFATAR